MTPCTMPRKERTPASIELNRENQRRSRARQREVLSDLQRRVVEYEKRDAQATLEMQRVARAVAEENGILREMLAMRGVRREEVEEFVVARRSAMQTSGQMQVRVDGYSTPEAYPTPTSMSYILDAPPQASLPEPQYHSLRPHAENPPFPQPTKTCAPIHPPVHHHPEASYSLPPLGSPDFYASDQEKLKDGMHCMEAASILAQLRGNPDATFARAALGCGDKKDCVIRNTDLLQLMDEMT